MLTGNGLDSLRYLPEIARLRQKTTQSPHDSIMASESQAEELSGVCLDCGRPVVLQVYPEGNGWAWYECDSCEKTATLCLSDGVTASESNPTAPLCESDGEAETFRAESLTPPQETPLQADIIADRIRSELSGRSFPIPIKPGESVIDLDVYAAAEARSASSQSKILAELAIDRLRLLGIDTTT